ncbi:MAG: hypothetical protein WD118_07945 [Phycisphaeraceae bacterium]
MQNHVHRKWVRPLVALAVTVAIGPVVATAGPVDPVYTTTFHDATTYQNRFTGSDGKWHWTIDADADRFPDDVYERPVMDGFRNYDGQFATDDDYFGYLDITEAHAGFDEQFLYIGIDLHDTNRYKSNQQVEDTGLVAEYRVRMSNQADGSAGYLFNIESPHQNLADHGYDWVTTRNYAYWDEDADLAVDGLVPDLQADNGSGFETEIVNDGQVKSSFVSQFGAGTPFYSRIAPGGDDNIVEFAIDYAAFGFSQADLLDLAYLVFESNRGNSSTENPDKYLLNHRFSMTDAGSPYADDHPDYGTQGLNDINEIDTLNGGGIIPEPGALSITLGLLALLTTQRRPRRRHRQAHG